MATISSATTKGTLDGSEYVPLSGTPKKKGAISAIKDYVLTFFTNKTTLDLITVADSNLQYNSIDVNNGFRKLTYSDKTASFTVPLSTNSKLMAIDVKNASSLTFYVGTSALATDVIGSTDVASEDSFDMGGKFRSADTTLYVTVTAGEGDFIVSYYKNW